ncbi:hypothetical protein D3C71_1460400 [compost metagenome]
MKLLSPLGFSNGCAELTPKNPPPLFPSSLIDRNDATGPLAISCAAPSSVVAIAVPCSVCGTPIATKIRAITKDIGRRMRVMLRIISTKKLPSGLPESPRMKAITPARADAGAANIMKTMAIICDKYDRPLSPL